MLVMNRQWLGLRYAVAVAASSVSGCYPSQQHGMPPGPCPTGWGVSAVHQKKWCLQGLNGVRCTMRPQGRTFW